VSAEVVGFLEVGFDPMHLHQVKNTLKLSVIGCVVGGLNGGTKSIDGIKILLYQLVPHFSVSINRSRDDKHLYGPELIDYVT
jgi:hypothetical protein